MAENREERVRERAHQIWEQEAKSDGRQDAHWAQAMEEIDAESEGSVPSGGLGASTGSLGTGGASTAGNATAAPKKRQ